MPALSNTSIVVTTTRRTPSPGLVAFCVGVGAMLWYVALSLVIAPNIQALYFGNSDVSFALTHFYDARQYAFICIQGYTMPPGMILPTLTRLRTDWMPVYAALQCGAHQVGLSMVYAGWIVSILAAGVSVAFASLTLRNLNVRQASWCALAVLTPLIGGAWLYLAGVEATFLAVGMVVMWLITLPTARTAWGELGRAVGAVPLGVVFMLTKPNALALALPLLFAFVFRSWQRSRVAGYRHGFWAFAADLIIVPLRPILIRIGQRLNIVFALEPQPIEYEWSALAVIGGIVLGLAYWLWFTSNLSGIPLAFLTHQSLMSSLWPGGNIGQMIAYFAQAFRGWGYPGPVPAWRYNAAWNLAANVAAVVPAASNRVPPLIRGMLPLMSLFLLYTGVVHGSDRYLLSTALVALGWACWVAPTRPHSRWPLGRALFVVAIFAITSLLLVDVLMPIGEPNAWGILDR